jgi:hypothetical protein
MRMTSVLLMFSYDERRAAVEMSHLKAAVMVTAAVAGGLLLRGFSVGE